MADRTSAELFGMLFNLLADNPTDEHKEMALKVWNKRYNYDFSSYQMYCDDALCKLGLAIKGRDKDYPEEEVMLYGPPEQRRR